MSVRARVALAFAIVALPATALVLWGAWGARREAAREALAAALVARMEEGGGRERCEADPARFSLAAGRRGRRPGAPMRAGRVLVYDARLEPSAPRTPPLDPHVRDALASGEELVEIDTPRGPALAVAMPWGEGPCAVLVVPQRGARPALAQQALTRDLGISVLVLGLALGVALIALGPPLARLRRLDLAVRRGGLAFEVPRGVEGGDEIGSVAHALGEASARIREHVARLEERDRALTSYVDATTHDLAIPLTVMQSRLAELDARVRAGGSLEPGALEPLLREHEYLGQLISNMAAAARFASGQPHVEHHPVDLRALVERVASRHAVLARAQGVVLEHAVPEREVVVEGDDILIERALSNLVHNAIRHGASGRASGEDAEGHVAIVLDARGSGRFRVAVADDGTGGDVTRVEEVLLGARPEASRPTDINARARGLGLRIVRAVADAHGWGIEVGKNEEGGVEIALVG